MRSSHRSAFANQVDYFLSLLPEDRKKLINTELDAESILELGLAISQSGKDLHKNSLDELTNMLDGLSVNSSPEDLANVLTNLQLNPSESKPAPVQNNDFSTNLFSQNNNNQEQSPNSPFSNPFAPQKR